MVKLWPVFGCVVVAACSAAPAVEEPRDPPDTEAGAPAVPKEGGADVEGQDSGAGKDAQPVDPIDDSRPVCAAKCGAAEACVGSLCCPAPTAAGNFSLPAHTAYVKWDAGTSPVSTYEAKIRVFNDPGTASSHYLAPVSSFIGTQQFYLGMQTDLYKPGVGGVGKGIIFSRFGTTSLADVRLGPTAGGFTQGDTYEGPFVGIRMPYVWSVGDYVLRLARAEADGQADWFELHMIALATATDIDVGGIRFPRTTAGVPATMAPSSTTFTELYAGAHDFGTAPRWHIGLILTADGKPVRSSTSEYPAYPTATYPNVDVYYDAAHDRVNMTHGGPTPKCHVPGLLFTR